MKMRYKGQPRLLKKDTKGEYIFFGNKKIYAPFNKPSKRKKSVELRRLMKKSGNMKTERYGCYTIHIKKKGKNMYGWCIKCKHPFNRNKTIIVRKGLALVENKKMVMGIAKEVIDKILRECQNATNILYTRGI